MSTLANVSIGFALVAAHWYLSGVLVDRLRTARPELFEKLGRPDLFAWNDAPATFAFWCWVFSRRAHGESADLLGMVWALRLLTAALVGWLLVGAVR